MDNASVWIDKFSEKKGRKPRILHIGNIANNAYQISKLLNERGAQSDVMCNDFYHIMSCPEWEDADFMGDLGDLDFPAWHKVNLHGFKRQRWFAQGPLWMCREYLLAKVNGNRLRTESYWRRMERFRKKKSDKRLSKMASGSAVEKQTPQASSLVRRICDGMETAVCRPKEFYQQTRSLLKRILNKDEYNKRVESETARRLKPFDLELKKLFPEYYKPLGAYTLYDLNKAEECKELFGHYDVIIGYATSCIYPYLAGVKNYIAFEHGTIRDFPYKDSERSRLTLLAYANAAAIYTTNTDCYESAQFLAAPRHTPIVYGLHGINTEKLAEKQRKAAASLSIDGRLGVSEDLKLIICPSRHACDKDRGVFLKGEDKLIRAAARLATQTDAFKLIMIDWGEDVDKIKAVIADYPQLSECIVWHEPFNKTELLRVFGAVDAVADQFFLHVFGGITFEALCAPKSVLISATVDESIQKQYFGEEVPMLSCYTEDEIYQALYSVVYDTVDLKKIAENGQSWLKLKHSKACIMDKIGQAMSCCGE